MVSITMSFNDEPVQTVVTEDSFTDRSGVTGFAELYITTWLIGGDISWFYPQETNQFVTSASGLDVVTARTVGTDVLSPGYVEVIVAVEVRDVLTGGNTSSLHFYGVGVETTSDGLAATGLPSATSKPRVLKGDSSFAGAFRSPSASNVEPYVDTLNGLIHNHTLHQENLNSCNS